MTLPALDPARLQSLLAPDIPPVQVFDRVASTNETLRRLLERQYPVGTAVVADQQDAGRGRMGRAWFSPASLGLYLSWSVRSLDPPQRLTRWTLVAAVAVCQACRDAGVADVEIEWPNDLVHRGRKLAGILAEVRKSSRGGADLVLGCGVNVGHAASDFPESIRAQATSLAIGGAVHVAREELAAAILSGFRDLSIRLGHGDPAVAAASDGLLEGHWRGLAPLCYDCPVEVLQPNTAERYAGRSDGIDPDGSLRVRRANGVVERVRMADAVTWKGDASCC